MQRLVGPRLMREDEGEAGVVAQEKLRVERKINP